MRLAFASFLLAAAVASANAQGNPQNNQEILRQRLLIQERINKGWDVQLENARDRIEGRCKAESRKRYSALHPIKRRKYANDCIRRAKH